MAKVILIAGQAKHGKDTFAAMVRDELERAEKDVLIVHFADYLKFIAEKYFGWDGVKDDKGRHLLQFLGTDIVRERNPWFWADIVYNLVLAFEENYDFFIIPDFRFLTEYGSMASRNEDGHKLNVKTVFIDRLNFDNGLPVEHRNHPSERELIDHKFKFDQYVINGGTLENLAESARLYARKELNVE